MGLPMIIYHKNSLCHSPAYGWDHGKGDTYMDRQERLPRILESLERAGLDELIISTREFDMKAIKAVHSTSLIALIRSSENLEENKAVYPYVFPYRSDMCSPRTDLHEAGYYCFDVGTVMHKGTFPAAKAASDTALEGAVRILNKETEWAFALSRPPGHHADRDFYGGLCFFNNAAIAARYLAAHGPTAILDLDFHHGNGTQGIFYHDADVLYVSIHGDPHHHFPFMTGHRDEIGAGPGEGYNLNYPLPAGIGLSAYLDYLHQAVNEIKTYKPEFLVVSMGFDAHQADILSDACFTSVDYRSLAQEIRALSYPTLFCLEGGYDLDSLGANVVNFIHGLMD